MSIAKGGATHLMSKITTRHSITTVESVHAEADAINRYNANMRFKGNKKGRGKLTLYVFRVNHNGALKVSRPCNRCQEKIKDCSRINSVISSTNNGFIEEKPREYTN